MSSNLNKPSYARPGNPVLGSLVAEPLNQSLEPTMMPERPASANLTPEENWARLQADAVAHAAKHHWVLYRNCLLAQAEQVRHEGLTARAAGLLARVLYLDLVGARNSTPDTTYWAVQPPFDPAESRVSPEVVRRFAKCCQAERLDALGAQHVFVEGVKRIRTKVWPITPELAWSRLLAHSPQMVNGAKPA